MMSFFEMFPMRLFCITLFILSLFACGGAENRKGKHIEAAKDFLTENNFDKARIEIKNAIQIDPKDKEAFLVLGEIQEKLSNFREAAKAYHKAVQLDEDNDVTARARLGKLYLLGRATDTAEEMSNAILSREPNHTDGILIRAGVFAQKEDYDSAVKDLKQVLEQEPNHIDATALLSTIYTQRGDRKESARLLEETLLKHPENTSLRYALVRLYMEDKQFDKGIEHLKKNTEISSDFVHVVRLAKAYSAAERVEDGEALLKKVIAEQPDNLDAKLLEADFVRHHKGMSDAEEVFNRYIEQSPKDFELYFGLADLYKKASIGFNFVSLYTSKTEEDIQVFSKNIKNTEATYQRIIDKAKDLPEGFQAKVKLAELYLILKEKLRAPTQNITEKLIANYGKEKVNHIEQFLESLRSQYGEGKEKQAMALLNSVIEENSRDREALMLRADYFIKNDQPGQAILDLRTILADNPVDSDALKLISSAHVIDGELELALESLNKAVQAKPTDVSARSALARLQTRFGYHDRAAKNYRDLLKLYPKNNQVHIEMIKSEISSRNYDTAKQDIERFIALSEDNKPLAFYLKGLIQQAEQKYNESIDSFETALAIKPESPEPLNSLIKSYTLINQSEKAIEKLNSLLKQGVQLANTNNLKGELLSRTGKHKDAVQSFRQAIIADKQWSIPYRNMAAVYMQQGDLSSAEKVYQEGISNAKNVQMLSIGLAVFYEQNQRIEDAISIYENMLSKNNELEAARNNLAMILVTHQSNNKASVEKAISLVENFDKSRNPIYLDTYGWVFLKKGDVKKATEILEKANSKAPSSSVIAFHLGQAYYEGKSYDQAVRHLEKAVSSPLEFHGKDLAKQLLSKSKQQLQLSSNNS